MSQRQDVDFDSHGTRCSAWLYTPSSGESKSTIVMAHGLGAVRDMRLDAFAERFASHGYSCFLFDYRGFGASGGRRRQLLDVRAQLEDWEAAMGYVKKNVVSDTRRITLFGTSLSGGYVITLAARHPDIGAAIAQCPYTDGRASMAAVPVLTKAKVGFLVIADLLSVVTGYHPIPVKLAGERNSASLMAVDDYAELPALVPEGSLFQNRIAARSALWFFRYNPGRATTDIAVPIHFAICEQDAVAPPAKTLEHAKRAPKADIKVYPWAHFRIYTGTGFEIAANDYVAFLDRVFA